MDALTSFSRPKKTILWPIIKLVILGILTLITVLVINTLRFSSTETFTRLKSPETNSSLLATVTDEEAIAMAERLSKAIQFPTVSVRNHPEASKEAFEGFTQFLEQSYPLVFQSLTLTRINDHGLLLHWQGSDPSLKPVLFLAHSDVVPVPDSQLDQWTYPPFTGVIDQGFIHGRGALDDKASLMGWLEALNWALTANLTPTRSIYFAFGHDEEVGGQYGAVAMAKHLEEQGIVFEFILDEGSYITKGMVPDIEERVALIGPGEKGYLSLKLTAESEAGHSSKPPKLTTAGRIAKAVAKIQANPFPVDLTYTSAFVKALGNEAPFTQRLVMANAWLFEPIADYVLPEIPELHATIRTTIAPTMLQGSDVDNALPDLSSAVINFRLLPGDSIQEVIDRTRTLIDDPEVTIEIYGQASEPSRMSSTESSGYQIIAQSIRDSLEDETIKIAPMIMIGATDARHYEHLTEQSYRFIGLTLTKDTVNGFHGVNEKVAIESYLENIRFYQQLLLNIQNH